MNKTEFLNIVENKMKKTSKKTSENSPNRQKSSKLAPEGACRGKFASWTPKSAKMKRKLRPRGVPGVPSGAPFSRHFRVFWGLGGKFAAATPFLAQFS